MNHPKHTALFSLLTLAAALLPAAYTVRTAFQPTDGAFPSSEDGRLLQLGSTCYGMTSQGGDYNRGTLFRMNPDGSGYSVLHHFAGGAGDGMWPVGMLIEVEGALYGMTSFGGEESYGNGTIFRINHDGSGFTLLHRFIGQDGRQPSGSLIRLGGTFYGMTSSGGNEDRGTVFRINPDGNGYTILHHFVGGAKDGSSPSGSLIEVGGTLYGLTRLGGPIPWEGHLGCGTIFCIQANGSGFTLLHCFIPRTDDGKYPTGSLVMLDGMLFGMTRGGGGSGDEGNGTIFRLQTDGKGYVLLHRFIGQNGDGASPSGSLTLVSGVLFGMTSRGEADAAAWGMAFKINPDGSGWAPVHGFTGTDGAGAYPCGSLTEMDGVLYGATRYGGANGSQYYGFGTIFRVGAAGDHFSVLHAFAGAAHGARPSGSLTESGGTLYGMTLNGSPFGQGTIFQVNPDGGGLAVLHRFAETEGDARTPRGSLFPLEGVLGVSLFGMTDRGGDHTMGTLFSLTPYRGEYHLLHNFSSGTSCGAPILVGTTVYGMTRGDGAHDKGTIFKVNRDGSHFTVLHDFAGGPGDGAGPYGSLTELNGAFYGTSWYGGTYEKGTIFRIQTDGSGFAVLHSFIDSIQYDSQEPQGTLLALDGALYGMRPYGDGTGGSSGRGTIFRIQIDGSGFAVLHKFTGEPEDGERPYGGLTEIGGTLYGMTFAGGTQAKGTLFTLRPDGSGYAILHHFAGGIGDGANPDGSLLLLGGELYGMTQYGGPADAGIIFSLNLHAGKPRSTMAKRSHREPGRVTF